MARLNAKKRDAMPASMFGMPAERKYPMPDASHAANAKARASQAANAGRISRATEARIDAKANTVLGKSGKVMTPKQNKYLHAAKQKPKVTLAAMFDGSAAKSRGEGSLADRRQDAALAKIKHTTPAKVERTLADRRADAKRK